MLYPTNSRGYSHMSGKGECRTTIDHRGTVYILSYDTVHCIYLSTAYFPKPFDPLYQAVGEIWHINHFCDHQFFPVPHNM